MTTTGGTVNMLQALERAQSIRDWWDALERSGEFWMDTAVFPARAEYSHPRVRVAILKYDVSSPRFVIPPPPAPLLDYEDTLLHYATHREPGPFVLAFGDTEQDARALAYDIWQRDVRR
jgi:hypothetical protein